MYFKIERADILAKFFDENEDGGIPTVEKILRDSKHKKFTKNINRVVRDVLIVIDTFEFSNYKITYPKSIIFQFDDCNLIVEKLWLFSLAGFLVFLDSPDAENFGLTNDFPPNFAAGIFLHEKFYYHGEPGGDYPTAGKYKFPHPAQVNYLPEEPVYPFNYLKSTAEKGRYRYHCFTAERNFHRLYTCFQDYVEFLRQSKGIISASQFLIPNS